MCVCGEQWAVISHTRGTVDYTHMILAQKRASALSGATKPVRRKGSSQSQQASFYVNSVLRPQSPSPSHCHSRQTQKCSVESFRSSLTSSSLGLVRTFNTSHHNDLNDTLSMSLGLGVTAWLVTMCMWQKHNTGVMRSASTPILKRPQAEV